MDFRTKIKCNPEQNKINYDSNIFLLGSCFSENIGAKLKYFKFTTEINPFGILFHPRAIQKLITAVINDKKFTDDDVFFHNERWHCFDAHSSLSANSKEEIVENLNAIIVETKEILKNTSHLIITLGTAWVYEHIESNTIVANCHKIPQKEFQKRILSIDEITEDLKKIKDFIYSINKDCSIIYTVSPVRHLKDGFIENQQSKSHLISAIHGLKISDTTHYFASYEIMMDELRDYRFYKQDMIHPNTTAIDYIWEKFGDVWLCEKEKNTRKEIDTIQKGLQHRTFNEKSEKHVKFLITLNQKIVNIEKYFKKIKFQSVKYRKYLNY